MSLAGLSCIGYVRVSTERQSGEKQTSIDDQKKAIEAAATNAKKVVQKWYTDDGKSGATVEQRPALRQLIADCEASRRKGAAVGLVLALNDSRWGRFPDPEEATYWRQHLKKHCGWVVRFAENDESDNMEFRTVMRAIGQTQATRKREDVRANAKRGSRGTAAQGFWCTREPYGFNRKVVYPAGHERVLVAHQRKAPDEKVMLTPHPEQAAVVAELFARYATGTESLASLMEWLLATAPGRKWTRAAVRFTLSNPAYCGDVVSGRVASDKTERAAMPRRPDAEWIIHRDAHPAIVDRALWLKCQDILARNGKWTNRVRTSWILSGLIHCPCGKPYVAGGGNANTGWPTLSYRCVTKAGRVADRCAYPGAVKKEWLESAVVDELARFIGGKAQQRKLIAQMDAALAERRNAPAVNATHIAKQIADATATRDRLVAAVADGTLTGDEAKDKLNTVRRSLARLEAQRDAQAIDAMTDRAMNAERDQLVAMALDFPRMAAELTGPALREFIRPWIAGAQFDPATRTLTLDIHHTPATPNERFDTDATASGAKLHISAERTTRRRVVVGGRR